MNSLVSWEGAIIAALTALFAWVFFDKTLAKDLRSTAEKLNRRASRLERKARAQKVENDALRREAQHERDKARIKAAADKVDDQIDAEVDRSDHDAVADRINRLPADPFAED